VARTERWALMEWILIRRRLVVVVVVLFALVLATGAAILEDFGISHLNEKEKQAFVHRQYLYRENGLGVPLIGRVPPEP
jgi:hypothetical protein